MNNHLINMYLKLTEEQLQKKVDFIENYKRAINPATASVVDANANVTHKNIATMESEINKDINVQINRVIIKNKIKELYGDDISNEFIRQIEANEIYLHDSSSLKPYCASITMYPLLTKGMTTLGGESKAPKNIYSFAGSFVNLVFAVASQFAGAVATVEFLLYFDYFARLEFGQGYTKNMTPKLYKEITQLFQHIVYSINQPAAARGYQSVFWNISVYDENYFSSLFGDFVFPDGDKPNWESLRELQKLFMKWFNKEREKALLTFPVITVAMLTENKAPKDKQFEDFIAQEMSEGNAFFVYQSDNVDSLASCCFDANQKCLTKSSNGVNYMTFKELNESIYKDNKRNFTVFHNGSWVKGKEVKLPSNRKMYKIITSNNKEIITSDNHIHPTIDGNKITSNLIVGDKLLFNTTELNSFPEKDELLSYSEGFTIGAFLGDGSFGKRNNNGISEINFSLSVNKIEEVEKHLIITNNLLGGDNLPRRGKIYNNVFPLIINNNKLVAFIQRWTNWEEGTYSYNKKINLDVLLQSKEFRRGILDGFYITDGGNSNRCYTTSKELSENLEVLITSLGLNSVINISDRTDEKVIIRGEESNRNYPLYCIRWYETGNKRNMEGVYTKKNNSIYFNIKSIEEIKYNEDFIYCFEMDNINEPYFTLPNGLITHNCRLRNEIVDNTFSYSLGAGGVSTGSINVITINFNRLIQDGRDLKKEIDKIHLYQLAYKKIIEEYKQAGLLPVYDAGFISLDKQFLTIGINGMVEAAEFLGLTPGNNNEYKSWVSGQLKIIYDSNKEIKKITGVMFNTEFVPAENLGVKNAKWDKRDGYEVNRECYNSYFYVVEDNETTVLDKFIIHGREIVQYLDGGSALHLNLEEYLTKENAINLLRISAKTGCNYFCTNIKITICNECAHINKETKQYCVKCGSTNIDYGTRVIGYLKRVSSFSEKRQEEELLRYYHLEG